MNTATIIENMNYLPSFATAPVKEAKPVKELSVKQAKFWRYTSDTLAIQPTGGDKPATRKTKAISKPLNFSTIYVGFIIDGQISGGFSLTGEKLFALVQAGTMPTLAPTLDAYLANLKEIEATLNPDQLALLS